MAAGWRGCLAVVGKGLIIKKNIYEIHNQSITSVAPKKQDFNKKTIWYSKEPEKLGE